MDRFDWFVTVKTQIFHGFLSYYQIRLNFYYFFGMKQIQKYFPGNSEHFVIVRNLQFYSSDSHHQWIHLKTRRLNQTSLNSWCFAFRINYVLWMFAAVSPQKPVLRIAHSAISRVRWHIEPDEMNRCSFSVANSENNGTIFSHLHYRILDGDLKWRPYSFDNFTNQNIHRYRAQKKKNKSQFAEKSLKIWITVYNKSPWLGVKVRNRLKETVFSKFITRLSMRKWETDQQNQRNFIETNQLNTRTDIKMDRLTTISASFFMAADIFAIISLATPDWIVTDVGGTVNRWAHNAFWLHSKSIENKWGCFFFTYFRWNSTRFDVDLYDSIQSTTSLLHTRTTTRMAIGTDLHFCGLHLHNNRYHSASVE